MAYLGLALPLSDIVSHDLNQSLDDVDTSLNQVVSFAERPAVMAPRHCSPMSTPLESKFEHQNEYQYEKENTRRQKPRDRQYATSRSGKKRNFQQAKPARMYRGMRFDSTKGYPGEGPPKLKPVDKRQKVCALCRQNDHSTQDCQLNDGGGRMDMAYVAAGPVALPPDAPKPQQTPEEKAEKKLNKYNEILDDLYAKSEALWASRQLASQKEFAAVTVSLATTARTSSLHRYLEDDDDMASILLEVNEYGRKKCLDNRHRIATQRSLDNVVANHRAQRLRAAAPRRTSLWQQFLEGWQLTIVCAQINGFVDIYTEVDWYENNMTFGYAPTSCSQFGIWMRWYFTLTHELLEELFKWFLTSLLRNLIRSVIDALAVPRCASNWEPLYYFDTGLLRPTVDCGVEGIVRLVTDVNFWTAPWVENLCGYFIAILFAWFESRVRVSGKFVFYALMHSLLWTFVVLYNLGFLYAIVLHYLWNRVVCALWLEDVHQAANGNDLQARRDALAFRLSVAVACPDICVRDWVVPQNPPINPAFSVRWGDSCCLEKFGARCMFGVEGYKATVFRQCTCNEEISLIGRVGKRLPQHDIEAQVTGEWRKLSREVKSVFDHVKKVLHPVPLDAWLNSFPPARRDELKRDYNKLEECRSQCASSFVKREIAPKKEFAFKDPRWIQGCPLWVSRRCGPWLRKYAKHLRKGLSPVVDGNAYSVAHMKAGRQFIYTCGMNTNSIGHAFGRALETMHGLCPSDDRVVVVEDDQSRFDMHIGKAAFGFLHQVYRMKIAKREVVETLKRGTSSGRGPRGTKYTVPYTMQSGWPDTSCGDTTVNAGMKYYIHGKGRPWICIANGDDSVTVTLESELSRLGGAEGVREIYTKLGMEVTIEVRQDPLDVAFCSSRFYPWKGTYILLPKPGRLLAKLGWDMKDRVPADRLKWVRGIASTLNHYGAVDPLLMALGNALMRDAGEGGVIVENNPYKLALGKRVQTDMDSAYLYYAHHYSMGVAAVDSLIYELSGAAVGDMFNNPMLQHMVEVDLA